MAAFYLLLLFLSSISIPGVFMQCASEGDPCNPPYPCIPELEMSDPDNCYGMQVCVAPYEWIKSEVECGINKGPYTNVSCTCDEDNECFDFECPPTTVTPGPPIASEPCFVEPTGCYDVPFYIPDRFYCTKYFSCQQGTFVSQTCTGETPYFNIDVQYPNNPCTNNILRCNLIPFQECKDFTTTAATTTQPTTTNPSTTVKTTTEPTTTVLTTTEPTTTEPTTTVPTTTVLTTTERTTTVLTTTEPTTTEPTTTVLTTTEPTTTVLTTTEPTTTGPTTTVLTTTEPTTTVLTTTEPTTAEPTTTEPTTTEPTTTESTTTEPTTTEPTTTEPTTEVLTTTEPTTTEPTTKEPSTTEPTTEEPTTAEPTTENPTTEADTVVPTFSTFEVFTTDLTHTEETTKSTVPQTTERLTTRLATSMLPTLELSNPTQATSIIYDTTEASTVNEWISSSTKETRHPSTAVHTHVPGTRSSTGITQTSSVSTSTSATISTTTSSQSTASTTTDPASPDACRPLGGCRTGEKVTHISECSLYFECFDGQWQLQDCNDVDPNNPLYNPDKEKCMKKPMVDCTRRCNTDGIRMNKMNRNIVIITILCTAGLLALILLLVLCCCNQPEEGSYSAKDLISKNKHRSSVTDIPLSVDASMELQNTDYIYHVSPPLGPSEDFTDVMLLEYRSKLAAGQGGIDVNIPADALQQQDMTIDISGDRAALYRPTDIDAMDKDALDPWTATRDPLYLDSMSSGPRPSKFGVMDI